jgi:hypothetical protein
VSPDLSRRRFDAPQRSDGSPISASGMPAWLIPTIILIYIDYMKLPLFAGTRQNGVDRQKRPGKTCRP